ncbi:MAG: type II toxin-antitoxin system VapC family toxin [Armatimonadota bacterium]
MSYADVMIAAYAQNRCAAVVTADCPGFAGLPVLVENWRSEE